MALGWREKDADQALKDSAVKRYLKCPGRVLVTSLKITTAANNIRKTKAA
jgi:hypothetical protein